MWSSQADKGLVGRGEEEKEKRGRPFALAFLSPCVRVMRQDFFSNKKRWPSPTDVFNLSEG
jgi:hypothetical protein